MITVLGHINEKMGRGTLHPTGGSVDPKRDRRREKMSQRIAVRFIFFRALLYDNCGKAPIINAEKQESFVLGILKNSQLKLLDAANGNASKVGSSNQVATTSRIKA